METVTVDAGTTVEYLVAGEVGPAPDLILLHGTGGSATTNWSHLLDGLVAPGRRVIALSYSGSGATTDPGGAIELSQLVAQAVAVADAAGSTQFDVAGFSLGAIVAAELAATHQGRVRRAVLIAGWASSRDGRAPLQFALWQHLASTDPQALAAFLTLTGFSPRFLSRRPEKATAKLVADTLATLQPGLARQAELDARIDLTDSAPRIAAPTLVIGSDEDQMVPVAGTRALAELIPGARYVELASGHLVLFEQPAELTELINEHLS